MRLTFKDSDNPIKKPHSKGEVIAVTVVLNFEKPTCLQANFLYDKREIESKRENLAKALIAEISKLSSNELITTDEYHTD